MHWVIRYRAGSFVHERLARDRVVNQCISRPLRLSRSAQNHQASNGVHFAVPWMVW